MKTNKEPEVQLIKNVEGRGPEDFRLGNTDEVDGTIEGKSLNALCSLNRKKRYNVVRDIV